jgi:hypothetical protein
MRSPDSRRGWHWRSVLEAALRGLALVTLGFLLWYAVRGQREEPAVTAHGRDVAKALVRWSTIEAPSRAHVVFDSAPSPELRDWARALASAGTPITWGGATPPPSGMTVEPVADPRHPSRVWVAAPNGARVVLRDALGVLDSATASRGGVRFIVARAEGTLRASVGMGATGAEATAAVHDSLALRPVLVLGTAAWEGKFALAALEEQGWKVDARFSLAPSGDVRQGPAAIVIDTSRYAVVIALDSVASRYAKQIRRYVKDGGGLIAIGDGAALASLASVLPATATVPPALPGAFAADTLPRKALALAPLTRLQPAALPLERRGDKIAAAAWRVGQGREVGYYDTWRWRLGGVEADPARAHRAWWAALVSSVAYAPRLAHPLAEPVEPTPRASLLAALGAPKPSERALAGVLDDPRLLPILFGVLLAALFGEWASRRLRGTG